MDTTFHALKDLFEQLGLPSNVEAINNFISLHAPLNPSILLADAEMWNDQQKQFLKEELLKDADWVESIDLLNSQLRGGDKYEKSC